MSALDKVSRKLYGPNVTPQDLVELRYFADYGHGCLGLFAAMFEGRLEDVLNEPGPPYMDEKDIPLVVRTLFSYVAHTEYGVNIPSKYRKYIDGFEKTPVSKDALFSASDL